MKTRWFHLLLLASFLILSGCSRQNGSTVTKTASLEESATSIIALLKEGNFQSLADHIHPDKGVQFAPYATLLDDQIIFSRGALKSDAVTESRLWGHYDGSGEPIQMSLMQYLEKFIYAVDYQTAPHVSMNAIIGQGNSINNLHEYFPVASFVEYHFAAFNPDYQGMDWRSLRLVFEQDGKSHWWLIAIINDQWTI